MTEEKIKIAIKHLFEALNEVNQLIELLDKRIDFVEEKHEKTNEMLKKVFETLNKV